MKVKHRGTDQYYVLIQFVYTYSAKAVIPKQWMIGRAVIKRPIIFHCFITVSFVVNMIGRVKFYVVLFLGIFTKWQKEIICSSCLSVQPHATTQFPLSGFS